MTIAPLTAYIVDDDAGVRDALSWLFKSRGIQSAVFGSGEEFLSAWITDMAGCLILDVRMGGMSGIELFDRLAARNNVLPTIFLTGHGDVPMAVQAIRCGAFEFLEKPVDDNALVDRVLEAFALSRIQAEKSAEVATIRQRLDTLSNREREVMQLVLAGKLNKLIADELGIAMRTVEVHRSRIFEKMGVRSAVELARILSTLEHSDSQSG